MNVRTAVIPVAGFGTRFLPVTRSVPKALVPVVDTPPVHYAVEEAAGAGIDRVVQPPARPLRSNGWFWATVALGVVSVILILAIAAAAAEEELESSAMPTAEVVVSMPTTIPTPVVATAVGTLAPLPTATVSPPSAIPTAVATLVPTATVIPTVVAPPVPPPTPGLSTPVPKRGLGVSRRAIEAVFTDFSFESSPLADGRHRSLAQSLDTATLVEIIGPDAGPTQATIIIGLPNDSPDVVALNTLYLLTFVPTVAPDWAGGVDWVMDKIDAMAAGESEARTTTGNLIVELSLLKELGLLNLTISAR